MTRPHGQVARYAHGPDAEGRPKSETGKGCRCGPCVEANRRYRRRYSKRRRLGHQAFVDAGPACRHLRALAERGIGYKQIAKRTGLAKTGIVAIRSGERTRIQPATARAILAIPLAIPIADHRLVDATRTWQRIEKLVALGYTKGWIASQIGTPGRLNVGREYVTAKKARAIRDLATRIVGSPSSEEVS